MLPITATHAWRAAHPGAAIGLLEISGADNTAPCAALEDARRAVEARLRQRYAGFTRREFLDIPSMAIYHAYYRSFDKTYHVLLQLESVVLKDKSLPHVSPLVDAVFAAELETLVLTAGHDVDCLGGPVSMDIVGQDEEFTQMGGKAKRLLSGDMAMRDNGKIVCTILYGQDAISPISLATTHPLYVAYAPPGVPPADIQAHLEKIEAHIRLFAPGCRREQLTVIQATG